MKDFVCKIVLGMLFALVAPASVAQWSDDYYYIGTGVGQATLQDFCPSPPTPGRSCGDLESSMKLLGGWQDDNSGRGWEAGYMRTNDFTIRDADNPALRHQSFKMQSLYLSSVYKFPINYNLSFFVKVGFHIWRSESTVRVADGDLSADGDGEDFMYGLGLEYRLGDAISMAVEWQRLPLSTVDLDDFSLSYRYRL